MVVGDEKSTEKKQQRVSGFNEVDSPGSSVVDRNRDRLFIFTHWAKESISFLTPRFALSIGKNNCFKSTEAQEFCVLNNNIVEKKIYATTPNKVEHCSVNIGLKLILVKQKSVIRKSMETMFEKPLYQRILVLMDPSLLKNLCTPVQLHQ